MINYNNDNEGNCYDSIGKYKDNGTTTKDNALQHNKYNGNDNVHDNINSDNNQTIISVWMRL